MVFAGVNLAHRPADPRTVGSHHYEQVFGDKPYLFVFFDNLNVGEALPVGAYLILAFHDQHPPFS